MCVKKTLLKKLKKFSDTVKAHEGHHIENINEIKAAIRHVEQAIECRAARKKSGVFYVFHKLFGDKNNRNLDMGATTNNIDNYIRDMPGFDETFSACKSGKDRDGILMTETTNVAIASHDDFRDDPAIRDKITSQTAKSSHQVFMAGMQGGTIGCYGIKKDSKPAIPKRYGKEVTNNLVQGTASFNNKLHGVKKSKWYSRTPGSIKSAKKYQKLVAKTGHKPFITAISKQESEGARTRPRSDAISGASKGRKRSTSKIMEREGITADMLQTKKTQLRKTGKQSLMDGDDAIPQTVVESDVDPIVENTEQSESTLDDSQEIEESQSGFRRS